MAFAAIDNLWKGAASQAVQNLNLMLGLPEGEGILLSPRRAAAVVPRADRRVLSSRWVTLPEGPSNSTPPSSTPGFRAGAVACGFKGGGSDRRRGPERASGGRRLGPSC